MHINNKIGWQKYEDLLHEQLDSPLLDSLYSKFISNTAEDDDDEEYEENEQPNYVLPVDERLMENISLASNFECWMGHTNFNITEEVRDRLKATEGVEILKICSRYRFFLGIGKMFNFTDVREKIETNLKGNIDGERIEQKQED